MTKINDRLSTDTLQFSEGISIRSQQDIRMKIEVITSWCPSPEFMSHGFRTALLSFVEPAIFVVSFVITEWVQRENNWRVSKRSWTSWHMGTRSYSTQLDNGVIWSDSSTLAIDLSNVEMNKHLIWVQSLALVGCAAGAKNFSLRKSG